MIEIDGSILEGGGQILRMSISLSSIIQKPIRIFNIRAKRKPPGLRMQHIVAIKSVATVVESDVTGLHIGSREVMFSPRKIRGGSFFFDIGTAGSTTLVLQALMPVAAYSPKQVEVEIRGGTNNQMAPPVEYFQRVFLPVLKNMNFTGTISLIRRGFYPKGGGLIKGQFFPAKALAPLNLTGNREVCKITGLSYSCNLPDHITHRMVKEAKNVLERADFKNVEIEIQSLQAHDKSCSLNQGCGIILFAELNNGIRVAADSLGEKGKPAEKVGSEAALNLISQLKTKAPVDMHLGDQLIVWTALADGISKIHVSKLTLHTLTSIRISEEILGAKIDVKGYLDQPAIITCKGVGLRNNYL